MSDKPKTEATQEKPNAEPEKAKDQLAEGELEQVAGGLNFTVDGRAAPTTAPAPALNPGGNVSGINLNHNQTLKKVRAR